MVTVELTQEDAYVLKDVLETVLSDIRMEICDTDSVDFRDGLKREKNALQRLISQLQSKVPQQT